MNDPTLDDLKKEVERLEKLVAEKDQQIAWLNLKLGTRAPCGVYRASNAWAECRVDLNVRVYRPSFLT